MTTCQHEAASALAAASPERPCGAIEWECDICSAPLGTIDECHVDTLREGTASTCSEGHGAHIYGLCGCATYTACTFCGTRY